MKQVSSIIAVDPEWVGIGALCGTRHQVPTLAFCWKEFLSPLLTQASPERVSEFSSGPDISETQPGEFIFLLYVGALSFAKCFIFFYIVK